MTYRYLYMNAYIFKKLLKSQIIIRRLLMGSEIVHSNQSIQPLLLSVWAVYLHATKTHSNVAGQHYSDLRQKPKCFRYQDLLCLAYRF